MSRFYTNVAKHGKFLLVIGYDNGKKFKEKIPYKPYLFLPSKNNSQMKTLQGNSVEKLEFDNMWDAKEFIKKYEDVSGFDFYGLTRWEYAYIHDAFPGIIDYDKNIIKSAGIDIEVDTEDGYPDLVTANKKITAITYRLGKQRIVFGYNDYRPHEKNITYVKCKNETELLQKFIVMWNTDKWAPDVITGWNIDGFDIPYLVQRITLVLGHKEAIKLSPWGLLRDKEVFQRGKTVKMFTPVGIAVLDYMRLYTKFELSQKSSYSLNNICHIELDEKKIDYSEYKNLDGLYKNNFQKFIEYNIRDVDLVFKLEDKLRYIELIYAVSYDAKVNLVDAFTSVLLWDIIIYNYLMDENIAIPQPARCPERSFEGAFVKDPLGGLHEHVVSLDVTSEYPKTLIQYNISPETFVKKIQGIDVEVCLRGDVSPGEYALTATGCMFRRDKQGFLPALMERQFQQRKDYQKKMKEENDEKLKVKYDKAQYAKKIQLNSLYGTLGNRGFRFYDPDLAEAITMSGQLAIQFMAREVNIFMNKICKTLDEDYIIASDTDSLYIRFGPLVDLYCKDKTQNEIVNFIDQVSREKLVPLTEQKFGELCKRMNGHKQAMEMKRENIANKALWTAKKRYIMNVLDSEGKRYEVPKLKIMGIETARSSSPQICRSALEQAIKIIMNEDEEKLHAYIASFKKEFYKAPFDEVAFPRAVNDLEKYSDSATIYRKGSPIQVRGALIYNKMLRDRKVKKWEPIFSGEKIKFAYLKLPNPARTDVIACPGFLPFQDLEEFIDYKTQFSKAFLEPLNSIISLIGWHDKKRDTLFG